MSNLSGEPMKMPTSSGNSSILYSAIRWIESPHKKFKPKKLMKLCSYSISLYHIWLCFTDYILAFCCLNIHNFIPVLDKKKKFSVAGVTFIWELWNDSITNKNVQEFFINVLILLIKPLWTSALYIYRKYKTVILRTCVFFFLAIVIINL